MLARDIEKEVVPWCIENEVGILAYSPLHRGLLTGKFRPDHEFKDGDARAGLPWYKKENIKRVKCGFWPLYQTSCRIKGSNPLAACLAVDFAATGNNMRPCRCKGSRAGTG
jgi:aryl-alcohol dehydrogenase-like predicted oxidoreductase